MLFAFRSFTREHGRVRVLVTGASGVLGRALVPVLKVAKHTLETPSQRELDLFDTNAVNAAVAECDAVVHLASRIPPPASKGDPNAWAVNDRLRAIASRFLVDAVLRDRGADVFVVPTVTMLYRTSPADEDTPVEDVPAHLRSALAAEEQAHRASRHHRRGVVLRLGMLYGHGTEGPRPDPTANATLQVADAASALERALAVPAGVYNVCDDGGTISNARFQAATDWRPTAGHAATGST